MSEATEVPVADPFVPGETQLTKIIIDLAKRRHSVSALLICEVSATGESNYRLATVTPNSINTILGIAQRAVTGISMRLETAEKERPLIERPS